MTFLLASPCSLPPRRPRGAPASAPRPADLDDARTRRARAAFIRGQSARRRRVLFPIERLLRTALMARLRTRPRVRPGPLGRISLFVKPGVRARRAATFREATDGPGAPKRAAPRRGDANAAPAA